MSNLSISEKIRFGGFCVILILALYILITKPISSGLDIMGQQVLAGLIITIAIWILKPFGLPYSIGGAFLMFYLLTVGLKASDIFSGFTSSALWTLIPALFFGYVLLKTGLGKRIAFFIIKIFKPSYPTMILAWVLIGVALSIMTPSITVRISIVMPIAVYCGEIFALKPGSKGNSLILLTAFAMATVPGTGWLTGALWGPIVQGIMNSVPETAGVVTFQSWSQMNLLPMEIVSILLVIGGYFVLKPKEKIDPSAIEKLKENKLPKMDSKEIITAIILVAVFILFLTKNFHGIPDAAVCLLALIGLFAGKVMEAKEFSIGISWDLVVFIGVCLSMGQIFIATGISNWLAQILVPAVEPLAGNPWLFVYAITIILFLWRFIDVAVLMPTMAILAPTIPVISTSYGINPLIWITIFVMAGNTFVMSYLNMWALMGQSICGERTWKTGHLAAYGGVYFAACMIVLAIVIPIWIKMGYFG